nr:glycosyltransferase [Clostridia bacterium]
MFISLVIPAYNEEKIIEAAVQSAVQYLDREFCDDYELIVVSDGSTDSTDKKLEEMKALYPKLITPGYHPNRGKGCAVRTGMMCANGDYVVFTDCDLAYGIEIVGTIAHKAKSDNADAVIGSRAIAKDGYAGYTLLRKIMSKTYLTLIRLVTGFGYSDSQCGIKCFTNKAAKQVFGKLTLDGFSFDLEALMLCKRMNLKVTELPAVIINHRESKVNPIRDAKRMLKDVGKIKKNFKTNAYNLK